MNTKEHGMSKEQIYKKLDLLKSTNGKITYLNDTLKKEKLLNDKTRDAVYETLIELLVFNGDISNAKKLLSKTKKGEEAYKVAMVKKGEEYEKKGEINHAIGAFKEAGRFDRIAEAYEKDIPKRKQAFASLSPLQKVFWTDEKNKLEKTHLGAAEAYEKIGQKEKAAEHYKRLAELSEVLDHRKKAGELYESVGKLKEAAEEYEKSRISWKDATRLYEKIGDLVKAADVCEKHGAVKEAMQIRKRLEKQNK